MHTSPLAQPGTGDGGGMNVYVRELSTALARSGVTCEVFTRAWNPAQPATIDVEPGFRVHHVPAGPLEPIPKEEMPELIPEFTEGVANRLGSLATRGVEVDALHANYWLSGVAGHVLKHELDIPLISTFHTLDRVKAVASPEELSTGQVVRRARAEAEVIGCSDAVLASCTVEADQIVELYGAPPARIEIVAPGVDHAFFGPGDYRQARRALGLATDSPVVLFVGRIQPLKALDVAVAAMNELVNGPFASHRYARVPHNGRVSAGPDTARRRLEDTTLVVVGGPSGPHGHDEVDRIRQMVDELGLRGRVRWVPPQSHELLSTFYRAADVCIVPSRSESFGLVALEAAACGVPVVASAVGGLTTLVDHGVTGYLVDEADPSIHASYVANVLGGERLAATLGEAAARRARRYTWSLGSARLRRLYGDLTARSLVECR